MGDQAPVETGWHGELARVRLRALFALPLIALIVAGGRAEACPPTNPQCAVDQGEKVVQDTLKNVPDTVEEVTGPVEETVEQVDKTVTDTTGDVQETVDEVLDPDTGGGSVPPPPTDPDPTPPGGNKNEDDPRRGDRVKDERMKSDGSAWRPDGRSGRPPGAATPLDPDQLAPSSSEAGAPSDENDLAQSALDAIKDFAFPLALTLLVGAFLAVQHRFDRRDPKLVLAPLDHDYLSFE